GMQTIIHRDIFLGPFIGLFHISCVGIGLSKEVGIGVTVAWQQGSTFQKILHYIDSLSISSNLTYQVEIGKFGAVDIADFRSITLKCNRFLSSVVRLMIFSMHLDNHTL